MLKNIMSMGAVSAYRSLAQFAFNIIIAAYVTPSDYGLIVYTAPFIAFTVLLTDMGLSAALVRKPTLSEIELGAAVSMSVALAVISGGAIMLLSGYIETISRMTGLAEVMAGMAISLAFTVASVPFRASLERGLKYTTIAAVEFTSVTAAMVISIIMMKSGAGVISLVAYNVSLQALRLVIFCIISGALRFANLRFSLLKDLAGFGLWILTANILNFLVRNLDNIIIGSTLGSAAVGLYGLSYQVMLTPLLIISWPVSAILLSVLCKLTTDREKFINILCAVSCVTASVTFPLMAFISIASEYPILEFMPDRWHDVVEIIQVLAPLGALQSVAAYLGSTLLADGHARRNFLVQAATACALVPTFLLAAPFGMHIFAASYTVVAGVVAIASIGLMCFSSGLRATLLLRGLVTPLAGSSIACVVFAALQGTATETQMEAWLAAAFSFWAVVVCIYFADRRVLLSQVGMVRSMKRPQSYTVADRDGMD